MHFPGLAFSVANKKKSSIISLNCEFTFMKHMEAFGDAGICIDKEEKRRT